MKIKVGYQTVNVRNMTQEESEEDTAWGKYYPNRPEIVIRSGFKGPQRARILIHEILHAAWDLAELGDKGLSEERVVARLDTVLAAIILDNPGLMKSIETALQDKRDVI